MTGTATRPYWVESVFHPAYPSLPGDLAVDVAVIGGGLVGVTTAWLLKQAGRRVAVIEARRIGGQVTGGTTAKITSLHGLIYAELASSHGETAARLYGEANEVALTQIAAWVDTLGIDCDFERLPAYTFTETGQGLDAIRREAEAAARLGLPASFVAEAPLPFPIKGAVRFDHQAQFHPLKYLLALAARLPGDGSHIFEETRVHDVDEGEPCRVRTERGTVTAREVVVATNLPILDRGGFFAKAFPARHMVLGAWVDPADAPGGMFLSAEQPSHSVRSHRADGRTLLIAVGGSFKTGHADTAEKLHELEEYVRRRFRVEEIAYRWGNQDYMPMDKIPYVGRLLPGTRRIQVATGLKAWGMTNGTVAATIMADAILGTPNPWADLYEATRLKPGVSAPTFASENLHVAKEWVSERLHRPARNAADLRPGEGALAMHEGEKVAAYRDDAGTLHLLSPVCTHMKCLVGWNSAERSWDCPCHGSRFTATGDVVNGPAVHPLTRKP